MQVFNECRKIYVGSLRRAVEIALEDAGFAVVFECAIESGVLANVNGFVMLV